MVLFKYIKQRRIHYIGVPPPSDRDLNLRSLEPTLLAMSGHRLNHLAIYARQNCFAFDDTNAYFPSQLFNKILRDMDGIQTLVAF